MSKKAKDFEGVDIREVWDWRLSNGMAILYDDGPTWAVRVWANNPPEGEVKQLLAEHVTDVATCGDPRDPEGVAACYEWLHSIRDDHARDNIELRKPVCAMIQGANTLAASLNGEGKHAEAKALIQVANREIKVASEAMHKAIAETNAGGAA
jgi:hypothetical protein